MLPAGEARGEGHFFCCADGALPRRRATLVCSEVNQGITIAFLAAGGPAFGLLGLAAFLLMRKEMKTAGTVAIVAAFVVEIVCVVFLVRAGGPVAKF